MQVTRLLVHSAYVEGDPSMEGDQQDHGTEKLDFVEPGPGWPRTHNPSASAARVLWLCTWLLHTRLVCNSRNYPFIVWCVHVLVWVCTCVCMYICAHACMLMLCVYSHACVYGCVCAYCVECVSSHSVHLGSWEAGCLPFQLAETRAGVPQSLGINICPLLCLATVLPSG